MAGEAGSSQRICGICGDDCSAKPRIKDASGRYFCKACVAAKEAAAGGAKAGAGAVAGAGVAAGGGAAARVQQAPDERSIMAKLVDESVSQSAHVCPGCRRPLRPEAVLCTACGFNRQTTSVVQTTVLKPKEVKGPKAKRRIRIDPSFSVLVSLVVYGVLLAACFANEVFIPITYAVISLTFFVVQIITIVSAFKDHDVGWGVVGILGFFLPCLGLGFLYYALVVTGRDYLKGLWLVNIVGVLAIVAVAVMTGVDPRSYIDQPDSSAQPSSVGSP